MSEYRGALTLLCIQPSADADKGASLLAQNKVLQYRPRAKLSYL
jgi:hypothetical protein